MVKNIERKNDQAKINAVGAYRTASSGEMQFSLRFAWKLIATLQ
jgi:hypothetical protein